MSFLDGGILGCELMSELGPSAKISASDVGTRGSPYRTAPDSNFSGMPPGVPYIIGNEAAERFSFYGMRSILAVFMTTYVMTANEATGWFHEFVFGVYFLPIFGAILSDGLLGKYRTIISLSVVYCMGHLALAINDTRMGLFIGLLLLAI